MEIACKVVLVGRLLGFHLSCGQGRRCNESGSRDSGMQRLKSFRGLEAHCAPEIAEGPYSCISVHIEYLLIWAPKE